MLIWSLFRIARSAEVREAVIGGCAALAVFIIPWLIVTGGDIHVPLFPRDFVRYATSFGLLRTVLSAAWPAASLQNDVFLAPFVLALIIVVRSQSVTLLCERALAVTLVLSPMVHAWYFTWLIPLAVGTRNAGSIAVSISAFAYFGISAVPGIPKHGWVALFFQTGMLWLPFICGFVWSEYRRIRGKVKEACEVPEYTDNLRLSPP